MPRTRSLAWSELKIGILAITALVMAVTLILMVGGEGGFFWQRYHLKTRFHNVQGLKPGAVVRVAGVEVGSVTSIEFTGAEVEVLFELRRTMQPRVTTESRATLGSLSLLGEAAVDITASTAGRPLEDWEYVTSMRTPGQLSDVAETATRSLAEATRLLQEIRAGRGTVGKLFTDDALYRELNGFVVSATDVVRNVNSGQGTLGMLMRDPSAYQSLKASLENLDGITQRINAGEGSLGRLLTEDAFATSLSTTTENLADLTARMRNGEGTAGKLVSESVLYDRLNSVSDRLDGLVASLEAGQGTAGRLLRDRELYENMNGAVNELMSLIGDIRRDPKKYLNVKVSIF